MSSVEVDQAWDGALIRSTSQTVFDVLRVIKNSPSTYRNRWLWELFQNAIDSSEGKPVVIGIAAYPDRFVFSHTGQPFSIDEGVQLILKGSTKRALSGKLGRFGTGFITTHVISQIVLVEGLLRDGGSFRFHLDRDCQSAVELESKMATAKEELKASLGKSNFNAPYTTRFSFPLVDNYSKSLVRSSLDGISNILPFVLAFNPEIGSVTLETDGNNLTWRKQDVKQVTPEISLVQTLAGFKDGATEETYVAITGAEESWLALRLKMTDGKLTIADLGNTPRIFAAFPLIGTELFPISAVLNSREFEPTDDRDGIWLEDATSPEVQCNRPLVLKGMALLPNLAQIASSESWNDLHKVALIPEVPSAKWINKDWLLSVTQKLLVELNKLPLLEVVDGSVIRTADATIPFSMDENSRARIWDIASKLFPRTVPKENLQVEWSTILKNWSATLASGDTELPQCLTIRKLAKQLETIGSVQNLNARLISQGVDTTSTIINQMLELAYDRDKDLLDSLCLIPDQTGTFRRRTNLGKDGGIDEELKNISAKLGDDIRSRVASTAIAKEVQDLLDSKTNDNLVADILPRLKALAHSNTQNYREANSEFFGWLVSKSRFDLLEGFPVVTLRSDIAETESSATLSAKNPLLAPTNKWNEPYKDYGILFPSDSILSTIYELSVGGEGWDRLREENLVLISPLLKIKTELDKEKLELLLADGYLDPQDHRISAEVITLAFLQEEGGVMDLVRDSQERATKFLEFLLKVLIVYDNSWTEHVDAQCECQRVHTFYPSMWLFAVRNRRWVPFPAKARRVADAESLARIFEVRVDLQGKLMEDLTSKFLSRLKISITDVLKNVGAKDEQTKLDIEKALASVFLASGKSVKELNTIAQIWNDPQYRSGIEKMVSERELVQRNQETGAIVEDLIREIFAESGIELQKIHRGGDFVYENDFTEPQGQVVLKADKYTIEVKTTSIDSIKMTPAQAEESVVQDPNYFLCVVQRTGPSADKESVRKQARFVQRIGLRLRPLVDAFHRVESEESEATSTSGDVQLSIQGTLVRFQVKEQVWANGLDLEALKTLFVRTHEKHLAPVS